MISLLNDSRETALAAQAAAADACRRCAIGSSRTKTVYADGNPYAPLMVVGEGPGEQEDRVGRPFVGPAGELLDKMLAAIGQDRTNTYIANVLKCRAAIDFQHQRRNRPPAADEIEHCREYLREQIALVKPQVILALGAPAGKWFVGEPFSVTRQRGVWRDYDGIPLMITFHPAYVLRS